MFSSLSTLPVDPLLGLIVKFNEDSNPKKIDLGVGVYRDGQGNTPVLAAVKTAETFLLESEQSKSYVGALGNLEYNALISELVLGKDCEALASGRVKTLQTPGGCGALRVAAELLVRSEEHGTLWVSDPTWANHVPLLGGAGLKIQSYKYYDFDNHQINFEGMLESLNRAKPADIVLLHGCCHNPCGADLSPEQWDVIAQLCLEKQLLPLIDVAYQGFGKNLELDAYGPRLMAETLPELLICVSCSKNFGLYRERVGAVLVVGENQDAAAKALSHMCTVARGLYSMPPSHGASIVAEVLKSQELRQQWQGELDLMRTRIQALRSQLRQALAPRFGDERFAFIESEFGMFSFLGISEAEVERLAADYSIYMASSSRINLAGLNEANFDYFIESLGLVIS